MNGSAETHDAIRIQEFIVRCVEHAGGAVEERTPTLLDALLPPSLNGTREDTLRTLALDPGALDAEPGAELATVGSPFLESLIAFAGEEGTTAVGHLEVERLRTKRFREAVEQTLLFSNCRVRYPDGDPTILHCWYAVFHFKVTFVSDEKRERLYVVPVNLWSNQYTAGLAEVLPQRAILAERTARYGDARRVPPDAAYETARRALNRLTEPEAEQYQTRVRKRFTVEFGRMDDYYAQIVRELRHRQERETDEKRIGTLEQRAEATLREREHKLHELGEKYHLRTRAQLTSARLLSQPKTYFKLLVDRKDKTRTLTLAYDSLLDRLEPPACEACGEPTNRIHVATPCRFLCPPCAAHG